MADFPPPPPPGNPPPPPPGSYPPPPGSFPQQPAWQAPPAPGGYAAPPAFGAPPAYAPAGYGYGYGAPPAMKAIGGLATALTILLAIMVLVDVAAAAAFFDRASLLDDAGASFVEVADADDRVAGAGALHFLGFAVTGIVWMIWQFRYVKNVQALGRPTGFSPGFAIGGWFIPIANWFIPEQQLAVSAKSSDPAPDGRPSTPGVVYAWWAALAAMTVLIVIASSQRPAEDDLFTSSTLSDFQSADRLQGVGMIVGVAAAILAILTVRACTKRQEQLTGQLASGTGGAPMGVQPQAYPQPAYQQPAYPPQQPAYPPQQPPYQQPGYPPQQPPYQPPPDQQPPTTF